MRRGGRAAVPRLARCERAAASRPYCILYSLQWPKSLHQQAVEQADSEDVSLNTLVQLGGNNHTILR